MAPTANHLNNRFAPANTTADSKPLPPQQLARTCGFSVGHFTAYKTADFCVPAQKPAGYFSYTMCQGFNIDVYCVE